MNQTDNSNVNDECSDKYQSIGDRPLVLQSIREGKPADNNKHVEGNTEEATARLVDIDEREEDDSDKDGSLVPIEHTLTNAESN